MACNAVHACISERKCIHKPIRYIPRAVRSECIPSRAPFARRRLGVRDVAALAVALLTLALHSPLVAIASLTTGRRDALRAAAATVAVALGCWRWRNGRRASRRADIRITTWKWASLLHTRCEADRAVFKIIMIIVFMSYYSSFPVGVNLQGFFNIHFKYCEH